MTTSPLQTVTPQATDAIVTTDVNVLGTAPAMAMGNLYQTLGNSVGMMTMNAVYAQQQSNMLHQAATTQGITALYNK